MKTNHVTSLTLDAPLVHAEMVDKFAATCWQQGFERATPPESLASCSRAEKVELMDTAVAQCLTRVLRQFESNANPFSWENRVSLALWPFAGCSVEAPTLTASIQTYYRTLEEQFLTAAFELPVPFLQGHDYRTFCFHAWLGQALIEGLEINRSATM